MAKIVEISKESVLRGKVKIGEEVLSFDDNPFVDVLDYIFADSQTSTEITVRSKKGEVRKVVGEKSYECETLGLTFDDTVDISPKECYNNCVFCFVSQLPKNLRPTLYIKDDDYRLSFISGSYITCTNLKEEDVRRILKYRLSPLYISVHATDDAVRKRMLGVQRCANQLELIQRLTVNGIKIHAQIVLVGGMNDGEVLIKSIAELYEIGVSTLAIVPVGLTGHREGLSPISPLTKKQASDAIEITQKFFDTHNNFCYCSDEMYQIAQLPFPDPSYYGEYEQIENGVGLVAKFLEELSEALLDAPDYKKKKTVGVFTGVSGESTMLTAKRAVEERFPFIKINVYPVKNAFFGETVTVTGLVTATDILASYGEYSFDDEYLVLPSVMLKEFEKVFLDDMSVAELQKKLHKKIVVAAPTGQGFVRAAVFGEKI